MNNLKDIHNVIIAYPPMYSVVLSGCQWTIWRIYTTHSLARSGRALLFCQDFNEQFEGYTQHRRCVRWLHSVVLSGCQWTIWRIYTTLIVCKLFANKLFCQDFNEQFEGYTQHSGSCPVRRQGCFVRISMNNSAAKVQKKWEICKFTRNYFDISEKSTTFAPTNLKDIHNKDYSVV